MELLDPMVVLISWGTSILLSTVPVTFPPTVHKSSFSFTSMPTFVSLVFFDILTDVRWYLLVVLFCISLMDKDAEICCLVLIGHLYIFFGEMSNQTFGPFLNWAIYVFIIENLRILYILWIQVLIRCMTYKYFFLFGGLSYHFIDSIVYNKSVKNFNEIQFIFFFFFTPVLLELYVRRLFLAESRRFTPV